LSTRDGKKARIDVSKTREEKDDGVVVALDDGEKPKEMQKLLHRTRALGKADELAFVASKRFREGFRGYYYHAIRGNERVHL
jgi:hypothetical protein